jgi:hypothetical protein
VRSGGTSGEGPPGDESGAPLREVGGGRRAIDGAGRCAQRAIYDQRRRDLLPRHGIDLVELSYADFAHDRNKCLCRRRDADLAVVRQALAKWMR